MRRGTGFALLCLMLLGGAACNKDEGVLVTPQDQAKLAQKQQESAAKQIADIEKDPSIPAAQKQMIIKNIRAGAARAAAGAQAGQAAATKKK